MPLPPPAPVLLDCDDVLLAWLPAFAAHLHATTDLRPDPAGPQDWDMTAWIGARDKAHTHALIAAFNRPETPAFSRLAPIEGAPEALTRLRAQGRPLHVITAVGDDPALVAARERNLRDVFGDIFASIRCVPVGGDKRGHLRALPRGAWIEDNHRHALAGQEIGHHPVVLRRSHNRQHEADCAAGLTWVDGWPDITAMMAAAA